jgi:hypothetical protein
MRVNIFTVGGVILNKGFILLLRMVNVLYFLILCVRHSWEQMMFIDAVFANVDGNTIYYPMLIFQKQVLLSSCEIYFSGESYGITIRKSNRLSLEVTPSFCPASTLQQSFHSYTSPKRIYLCK